MNATICKMLRKAAWNASLQVGEVSALPLRRLIVKEIKKFDDEGKLVKRSKVAINSPLSFRGIYRHLKGVYG